MADYNFIMSIAGLNTAINLNDNVTVALSETPDLATIKTKIVLASITEEILDVTALTNFGFLIIQNIDDNNDVDIIIETDLAANLGSYQRLQPNQMMFLNSDQAHVAASLSAFIAFDTITSIFAKGINGNAKVKIIHIG